MPIVTVVHIIFDNSNDPGGVARRHIAREIGKGVRQTDVVREAWYHPHTPVPDVPITSTSATWPAPPFTAVEIYYDPMVVDGAPEKDVIDTLIKAGRR
jgi:hypothetical protein